MHAEAGVVIRSGQRGSAASTSVLTCRAPDGARRALVWAVTSWLTRFARRAALLVLVGSFGAACALGAPSFVCVATRAARRCQAAACRALGAYRARLAVAQSRRQRFIASGAGGACQLCCTSSRAVVPDPAHACRSGCRHSFRAEGQHGIHIGTDLQAVGVTDADGQ